MLVFFGQSDGGQLANGDEESESDESSAADCGQAKVNWVPAEGARQVVAGSMLTMVLCEDGRVFTCGCEDVVGRLGNNGLLSALTFPPCASKIVAAAAGEAIAACLDDAGNVFVFGFFRNKAGDYFDAFGNGLDGDSKSDVQLPRQVHFDFAIIKVACSESMVACVDVNGNLFTWGCCESGEGGRPPTSPVSFTPVKVNTSELVVDVYAFGFALFFKTEYGCVFSCGNNGFGELGIGHQDQCCEPVRIPFQNVSAITGGMHHCLLLTNDGQVFGAGKNEDNQIGLPDFPKFCNEFKQIPLPADFVYPAIEIAAGVSSSHSCKFASLLFCRLFSNISVDIADIVDSGGSVYSFGYNEYSLDSASIVNARRLRLDRACKSIASGSQFTVMVLVSPGDDEEEGNGRGGNDDADQGHYASDRHEDDHIGENDDDSSEGIERVVKEAHDLDTPQVPQPIEVGSGHWWNDEPFEMDFVRSYYETIQRYPSVASWLPKPKTESSPSTPTGMHFNHFYVHTFKLIHVFQESGQEVESVVDDEELVDDSSSSEASHEQVEDSSFSARNLGMIIRQALFGLKHSLILSPCC